MVIDFECDRFACFTRGAIAMIPSSEMIPMIFEDHGSHGITRKLSLIVFRVIPFLPWFNFQEGQH
jgi:hypothetical protein